VQDDINLHIGDVMNEISSRDYFGFRSSTWKEGSSTGTPFKKYIY
jgi:hypothetical protein